MADVSNLLYGKRVVITGGAGLLGRHLCAAVAWQGGVAIIAHQNREAAEKMEGGFVVEGGRPVA